MPNHQGIVLKTTGSWLTVLSGGQAVSCKLKGTFRLHGIKTTNPVAVGDGVEFDFSKDQITGLIRRILPRKNYIIRKATKLSKQAHILAANIDQAVAVVTLASPRTSNGFIDRFLVTAEAYHIPGCLVFNKTDIYSHSQNELLHRLMAIYTDIGYTCLKTSALTGDHLDQVRELLQGKSSLLTGHSGVGKSALINALEPSLKIRTGPVSSYHDKGKHTTTFAEMHPLSFGGYIIDTPGIREFGLVDFSRTEVAERFPEMRKVMHQCKFHNCTHVHEPGCAVKKLLEEGMICPERYYSYLSILNDDYWKELES
ncbi:MAG: ribosome small subunit-dependent GTPase A [Bacteroidales bacterium]|nr:ribosome small subunit-dependent GTPase A [Bacteroidales bacterium]